MIAFPSMLVNPAKQAGIAVPPDPDNYEPEEFKHFHFFCTAQLGQSMPTPSAHWENAVIIAAIPEAEIKTIIWSQLISLGFAVGMSTP